MPRKMNFHGQKLRTNSLIYQNCCVRIVTGSELIIRSSWQMVIKFSLSNILKIISFETDMWDAVIINY